MKTWLLIVLFPIFGYSQVNCDYYNYISTQADYIETKEFEIDYRTQSRIDFTAFSVPDSIIISVDGTEYGFYIGQFINQGFWEFRIEKGSLAILQSNAQKCPSDFFNGTHYDSSIRLWVVADDCKFVLRLHGNESIATAFVVCVSNHRLFEVHTDTIVHNICDSLRQNYTEIVDCNEIYHQFVDNQIYLKEIKLPDCENIANGFITFTDSSYNLKNILTGLYFVETDNGYCKNSFTIPMPPKIICQNYFVPNITRDQFGIYSSYQNEYELFLFNRWGGLVLRAKLNTNEPISLEGFLDGVYVYYFRDIKTGKIIKGDVTKI